MDKSESKRTDINYRIKKAYNIYYTKSDKCQKTRPVIIRELLNNVNLVKYDRTSDFLDTIIDELMNAELSFLSKTDRVCSFIRSSDDVPKTKLDIVFYKKKNDVDNNNSDVNVHSITKYLLFSNQGKKISISIPLLNFDVEMTHPKVKEFIESNKDLESFVKKIKKGDLANILSFQLTEAFFTFDALSNKIGSLDIDQLKSIIFQYASTLSYLQNKYSSLRLNNSIGDFFVYHKKGSDRIFNYFIEGTHYGIPDTGVQLKIDGFLSTSVSVDDLNNDSLSAAKKKENKSSDLVDFLAMIVANTKGEVSKTVKSMHDDVKKNSTTPLDFIKSFTDYIVESTEKQEEDPETSIVSMGGGTEFFKDLESSTELEGGSEEIVVDEDILDASDSDDNIALEKSDSDDNIALKKSNRNHKKFEDEEDKYSIEENITEDESDLPDLDDMETESSVNRIQLNKKGKKKSPVKSTKKNKMSESSDLPELDDISSHDSDIVDNTDYSDLADLPDLDTDSDLEDVDQNEFEGVKTIKLNKNEYVGRRKLHSGLTEESEKLSQPSNRIVKIEPIQTEVKNHGSKLGSLLGATGNELASRGRMPNTEMPVNNDSKISSLLGTQAEMPTQGLTSYDNLYKNEGFSGANNMPLNEGMPMQGMPEMPTGMQGALGMQGMPTGMQGALGMPTGMQGALGMPTGMQGALGMPTGMPQMQGMPTGMQVPLMNQADPYSPTPELDNVYSPAMSMDNLSVGNNMQNVQGLSNLPPDVRKHAMSALNTVPQHQNGLSTNIPMNNNFNALPTMNDIQNQNLGNTNFLPPNMQQQFVQQQPSINVNQAQNILGNLPQGYTGDIPLELASNLPMIGGGQKKKTLTEKNVEAKNVQKGGTRTIPKYVDEKNTPFRNNERKNLETAHYKEKEMSKPEPTKSNSLVEFKVSDAILHQNPQQQRVSRMIYPSPYVPIQQPFPEQYPYVTGQPMNMYPWLYQPNNVPYIKNYNVSLSNPAGDHIKISDLYEDMLPGNKYKNTSTTLGERLVMTNFVRSVLVRTGDGEDIDINGKIKDKNGKRNLFSYLKLLELNPYHDDQLTGNPYSSLPDKMIVYRSCYPIRLDQTNNKISCSRTSIGMNIRIYDMTVGEINAGKLGEDLHKQDFDLWREVAFYEYIREEIIKKNVCPNFPIMYAYFCSSETGINFNKLRQIKSEYGKDISKNQIDQAKDLNKKYKDTIAKQLGIDELVPLDIEPSYHAILGVPEGASLRDLRFALRREVLKIEKDLEDGNITAEERKNRLKYYLNIFLALSDEAKTNPSDKFGVKRARQEIDIKLDPLNLDIKDINVKSVGEDGQLINANINFSSGKCLLALTEAPHYNLLQWASRAYQAHPLGPVKKMINTGYHETKVWYGVIFQILAAMQVLYKHKLAIKNMKLRDNIYIKDLLNNDQTTGYWKYKIDDYEYFIPNNGYLVMIDSNYKDLQDSGRTVVNKNTDPYKMFGYMVGGFDDTVASDDIKKVNEVQYENLKSILNPNNFSKEFTNDGGIHPGSEVVTLFNTIYNEINSKTNKDGNLSEIIPKVMRMFLHNRIGTPLSEDEIKNINTTIPPTSLTQGNLYAVKYSSTAYTWGMYLGVDPTNISKVKILTRKNFKDTEDIIEMSISKSDLYDYTSLTEIQQKYKPNEAKLTDSDLLETYII